MGDTKDVFRVFVEFDDGTYISTLCDDFTEEITGLISGGEHGDVKILEIRGPEDWAQEGIPRNPTMPDLPDAPSYEGFKGKVTVEVGFDDCSPERAGAVSTYHERDCRCGRCCPKSADDAAQRLYRMAVDQFMEGLRGDRIDPADVVDALAFALGQPNSSDLLRKLEKIDEEEARKPFTLGGPGPQVPVDFDASQREEL